MESGLYYEITQRVIMAESTFLCDYKELVAVGSGTRFSGRVLRADLQDGTILSVAQC